MDIHVRRLGSISIIFGVVSLVVGLLLLVVYGGPRGLYYSFTDTVMGFLVSAATLFHLLLSIPCIIGGVAVRNYSEWSRSLMIVACALNILNPPLGSMLGAYGLWVLLTPETDPLFSDRPPVRQKEKAASAREAEKVDEVPPNKARSTTIVPSPRS
jgi:hypothetical protein